MKNSFYVLIAVCIIGLSIYSCEKDGKQTDLKGQLISKSECKSNLKSAGLIEDTPDSLSCVEYSFNNLTNKLTLKHINAGFNCCQDSIYCRVSLENDTIIINEIEENPICDCDCLYDLNIDIQGVESKKYQIKMIEPYAIDQNELLFEIDLTKDQVGSFCVTRKQYPWGVKSVNH